MKLLTGWRGLMTGAASLWLVAVYPAFAAENNYEASTGLEFDSNISFGSKATNRVTTFSTDFAADRVFRYEPKFNRAYLFRAGAKARQFARVPQLDHVAVHGRIDKIWQNEYQYTSPFFVAGADLQYTSVADEQRDNFRWQTYILRNQRLNDQIFLTQGARFQLTQSRWQIDRGNQVRLFLAADLLSRRPGSWYGVAGLTTGNTWSAAKLEDCSGNTDTSLWSVVVAASEIELDQAFNDAFCGQWFAYKLSGSSLDLTVGYNRQVSRNTALDLSWVGVVQQATGGAGYSRQLVRGALLWQW